VMLRRKMRQTGQDHQMLCIPTRASRFESQHLAVTFKIGGCKIPTPRMKATYLSAKWEHKWWVAAEKLWNLKHSTVTSALIPKEISFVIKMKYTQCNGLGSWSCKSIETRKINVRPSEDSGLRGTSREDGRPRMLRWSDEITLTRRSTSPG